MRRVLEVVDLGIVEYEEACSFQKKILEDRKRGLVSDTLIILEHPHTITLGRQANISNILIDEDQLTELDLRLYPADRGGDVTYHGPGQLVAWPVVDLKNFSKDLHFYIRALESVVIRFLENFNIQGSRRQGFTGVWIGNRKIASIGIGVSGWVTFHGISINIDCQMEFFWLINPCGLNAQDYITLSQILPEKVDVDKTKDLLINSFEKVFDFDARYIDKTASVAAAQDH